MCTLTIIPQARGVRLGFNRDESRTRPVGLPPRIVRCGDRQALMPIDPQSGGTWIAGNDAGLMFAIMNVYPAPRPLGPAAPKQSRGGIIPRLLEATTLEEAFARTGELPVEDYAGFRLVIADAHSYAQLYSTEGIHERTPPNTIQAPLLFTSSGIGDAIVDAPRRVLFEDWFVVQASSLHAGWKPAPQTNWRELQDAYHRHSWPERRHVSVCMSRPEARTVSYTIVEIDGTNLAMTYFGEAPDQPVEPVTAQLNLRPTSC